MARTVCAVHVDVTTIEDCEEVITTQCSQTQQSVAHASSVVGTSHVTLYTCHVTLYTCHCSGHDTRVGPASVVAVHEHAGHGAPVVGHPGPAVSHVGPHAAVVPAATGDRVLLSSGI